MNWPIAIKLLIFCMCIFWRREGVVKKTTGAQTASAPPPRKITDVSTERRGWWTWCQAQICRQARRACKFPPTQKFLAWIVQLSQKDTNVQANFGLENKKNWSWGELFYRYRDRTFEGEETSLSVVAWRYRGLDGPKSAWSL